MSVEFHYHPFFVDLVNNGHTLIERVIEPKALKFDSENYTLLQFHFHTPSEHHIDSKEFPLEIHFIHQSFESIYAILGVLVEEGVHSNHFLEYFMNISTNSCQLRIEIIRKSRPYGNFPQAL